MNNLKTKVSSFIAQNKIFRKIEPLFNNYTSLQEKIDLHRTVYVLKIREHCKEKVEPPTDRELENFQDEIGEMDPKSQNQYAKSLILSQVTELFQKFENDTGKDAHNIQADEQQRILLEPLAKNDSAQNVNKKLLTNFRFSVKSQKSLLPNAGNGVFISIDGGGDILDDNYCMSSHNNNKIDKVIVPGTVVAFFPGLVYTRGDLRRTGAVDKLFPDNNLMLMSRYDGTIIDSRTANQTPSNPFSLAHKVNHCGNEHVPNVLPVAFDWPEEFFFQRGFPRELRPFIPNQYARPQTLFRRLLSWNYAMKGVALLSTRPLRHGEELLMDYRLNPTLEDLPPWYRPYDAEEARMRWGFGDEEQADESKREVQEKKEKENEKEWTKTAKIPRKPIIM